MRALGLDDAHIDGHPHRIGQRVEDPFVAQIVKGWAGRYDPQLAAGMGFAAEKNFDEIIKVYQQDEMGQ